MKSLLRWSVCLLAVALLGTSGCQPTNESESPDPPEALQQPQEDDSTSASSNEGESSEEPSESTSSESRVDTPSDEGVAGKSLPKPAEVADVEMTDTDELPILDAPEFVYDKPVGEERALKAFAPPPGAKRLTKEGRLWVDPKRKRVYIDGYVTMIRGPLEMLACPVGTKEHESIVAVLAKSRDVHASLLAVDATPGTPVRFRPEFLPPTGQIIRVYLCWYDKQGNFKTVDARQWVLDLETQKEMTAEWVFAGSGFWQDPQDKREYYQADSGDMICVSNFSSAMMDVAMPSSADAGALRFETFESRIPELDTPLRVVLVPVPEPTDDENQAELVEEATKAPTADDVPRQSNPENG